MNTTDIFVYLDLEPVQYYGPEDFTASSFTVNATSFSDFENILLTCTNDGGQGFLCSNHTVENANCTTSFKLNITLGCNYTCSFTAKKSNYTDVTSGRIILTIGERLCNQNKSTDCVFRSSDTESR